MLQSTDPEEEKRQKSFQGILNKITPDNFERLTTKVRHGVVRCVHQWARGATSAASAAGGAGNVGRGLGSGSGCWCGLLCRLLEGPLLFRPQQAEHVESRGGLK